MNSNIRLATIDDLDAINDIYNYEVLNGIATFDVQERTYEEAEAWFNEHDEQEHPIFVYELDDEVIYIPQIRRLRSNLRDLFIYC